MSETTPEAGRYAAVPPQVDLPAMEHEIIDLWHRQHLSLIHISEPTRPY